MKELARRVADDVLFPAAGAVDRADRVPASHLDLFADSGFYGPATGDDLPAVVELLASGCLATTFVWIQHLSPLFTALSASSPWAGPLSTGEKRAGIAYAGLAPGSDLEVIDGCLTGHVPWVTGWDLIDFVQVAVREGDLIRYYLLDAAAGPTLQAEIQELVAVQASRTVSLTFAEHPLPPSRLVATEEYEPWAAKNASGAALNGCLSLGLVRRASLLLESSVFDASADKCRSMLFSDTAVGRAAASELAWRAAGAVLTQAGSRGIKAGETAQRLVREAAFLLVFGSRPAIKAELYRRMTS